MTITTSSLSWPPEAARYPAETTRAFAAPGSNLALDFHGDPATAKLAIFSDGNHHMALEAVIQAFLTEHPDVEDIFYTTTPPAPLVDALKGDGLALGNLLISRKPDVFISPENILHNLVEANFIKSHVPFAESRGNVILVQKGNPKNITSISDLLSDSIRLACSNPVTEKASYSVYEEAARQLVQQQGMDGNNLVSKLSTAGPATLHSQIIHHREVPELIASGKADAAIIYYHLALRYTRIFPSVFDLVDIDNVASGNASSINPTTQYHIGLVNEDNEWGKNFIDFMKEKTAQSLYQEHGLNGLC